jgi:hypothetical protein
VARLAWERLYDGDEADRYHALAVPGDGSLVRARIDPATAQVLVQRVAAPGPGADFASWSTFAASTDTGIALASYGATVLLFFVHSDGVTIKLAESGNYGQSFGAPGNVAVASGAVGRLAADVKSDGTTLLVYSVGGTVFRVRRSGGSWGAPAAWTNSVATVSGLACRYSVDFNVVICGTDSVGAAKLWVAVYGDGFNQPLDTWSTLWELSRADPGSNVSFRAPFVDKTDVFRMLFVEKYAGSEEYARPQWSNTSPFGGFLSNNWRDPVPFDLSSEYGVAIAHDASHAWLSTPSGVWRASTGAATLDLTGDVLEAQQEVTPFDGKLRIVLRNDDGRYAGLADGPYAAIKRSSQIDFSPGYVTSGGVQVSTGQRYWIEGWEYERRDGKSAFVLYARDGWWLLRNWRARRVYAWGAGEGSVAEILSFIFARSGLEFASLSSSEAMTLHMPAFAIHPGEDGLVAVRRLLEKVPDVIRLSGEDVVSINPLPDQDVDYDYGAEHPVLSGRYGEATPAWNRAQVFGQGVLVNAFDWPSIGDVYDRLRQVSDLNLTTPDAAQERADALLREEVMSASTGEIVVAVNCGQELYDVVSVTDALAGLAEERRRIVGLALRYARGGAKPLYEMRLRLSAV